jgi:hypothetical protein
LGDGNPESGN